MSGKTYKAARVVRDAKQKVWSKTEARISTIGIIVSTIGVLIAAISTFLTYRQIVEVNRERMTPYRTVLYTAKVDAYRQIVGQSEVYRRALVISNDVTELVYRHLDRSDFNAFYGAAIEDTTLAASASEKLRDVIAQNKVVWPKDVADQLGMLDGAILITSQCPIAVAKQQPGQFRPLTVKLSCEPKSVKSIASNFVETLMLAQNLMRRDIQADQLEVIDPR